MNAFNKWDCQFDRYDNVDMDNCNNREDPGEWLKTSGKNVRKDVLKRMIQIGLAIDAAAKNAGIDPNDHIRRLANDSSDWDNMDFGDLNKVRDDWMRIANMRTDKERIAYIRANSSMIEEVPFAKIRLIVRKMVKP